VATKDALEVREWGYNQFQDFAVRWAAVGFSTMDLRKIRKEKRDNISDCFLLLNQKERREKQQYKKTSMSGSLNCEFIKQNLRVFKQVVYKSFHIP